MLFPFLVKETNVTERNRQRRRRLKNLGDSTYILRGDRGQRGEGRGHESPQSCSVCVFNTKEGQGARYLAKDQMVKVGPEPAYISSLARVRTKHIHVLLHTRTLWRPCRSSTITILPCRLISTPVIRWSS